MKIFSNEYKETIANALKGKFPILVTGLHGSGKLYATKRVLQDLNYDFEVIEEIRAYTDIPKVWKQIAKAPDKNYLLDISNHSMCSAFKPFLESVKEGTEIVFATKNLNLKFVMTGKLVVVTHTDIDESFKSRCIHIEG